jgi:hypothetical protein
MKKIILMLLFLSIAFNAWSQKHSFGIGTSAYNYINDGYGYKFTEFVPCLCKSQSERLLYLFIDLHLFYEYKIDSTYSIRLANDLFVHKYRAEKDFLIDQYEVGLSSRVFSTTSLTVNRVLWSKWRKKLTLRGVLGLSYRNGDEFFFIGKIGNEYRTYTVGLNDLGVIIGGEARYNFHKKFFVNGNLNFIDYVIGSKQPSRVSIFNKSWTVFQANFSVGVNF